jgi:putative protein-disulfide isomerase
MTPVLHYIYDPLCGWCYGAGPLVRATRDIPGLALALHGGGMMAGPNKQRVTENLRRYVMEHDRRIAALSGQPFGDGYFNGLLRDSTAVLDSEPPIAAILTVEQQAGRGPDMLARIQRAHYVEGRRISDTAVLVDLAGELGLDRDQMAADLAHTLQGPVQQHIDASRRLLARVGGQQETLDLGRWFDQPEQWRAELARRVA